MKRNRFWVVRKIRAHGGGYEIIRGTGSTPNPYNGSDSVIVEIDQVDFHASSPIRLEPGEGPVELEWPLFKKRVPDAKAS